MKYGLMLNDMRQPNIENLECVKVSSNKQELVNFYKEHLAEKPYSDGQWRKIFKKNSPLEWFNNANLEKENDYFGGIYTFEDEAPNEAIMGFKLYKN